MHARTISLLSLSLILTVILAGCATLAPPRAPVGGATPAAKAGTTAFPFVFTDDVGREVRLDRKPERFVSIAPSNTEILFALGLGDRVVGVDQFSNYPPEATQKTQLGSYIRPDLEQIVAAAPDLVLGTGVHVRSVVPALQERGIAVIVLDPKDVDGVYTSILRVGQVTGTSAEAERLVGGMRERATAVSRRIEGTPAPRVFVELSPQLHTVGPGTFIQDVLTRAGGANIAADAETQYPQFSQELLIERNPEVILMMDEPAGESPTTVAARPGWGGLAAIKNGRVVVVDPDVTNRPGPRVVDAIETIARALHPERFR